MASKTLRLSARSHDRAAQLAELQGGSMASAVAGAIDAAYQHAFWESAGRQVAALRRDPDGWAAYRAETHDWQATDARLPDGDVPAPADQR